MKITEEVNKLLETTFGTLGPDGTLSNVRQIKQSDYSSHAYMGKCPFFIMDPSHYRDDGSCKCNDPEHRKMMKKEWGFKDRDFKKAGLI